jgi:hypothetical protein
VWDGAELHHLDRPQGCCRGVDRALESGGVADVGGEALGGDAVRRQVIGERVEVGLVARDQCDGKAFTAKSLRDGGADAAAGAHDDNGGHGFPSVCGGGAYWYRRSDSDTRSSGG